MAYRYIVRKILLWSLFGEHVQICSYSSWEKLPHSQVKQQKCVTRKQHQRHLPTLPSTLYFTVPPGVTEEGSWCDCNQLSGHSWLCLSVLVFKPVLFTLEGFTAGFVYSCFPMEFHTCLYVVLCVCVFCVWFCLYVKCLAVLLKCQRAFWCFVSKSILIFTSWILQLANGFRKNFDHICAIRKGSLISRFPRDSGLSLGTFVLKYCFTN